MAYANEDAYRADGITPQLDALSSQLMGDAFDLLAEGRPVNVLLVISDAQGNVASYEFAADGVEACLDGAHDKVRQLVRAGGDQKGGLASPVRYALAYEGAVSDESGAYQDALLLEFGEEGHKAFSAYSYVDGRGEGDGFRWTDPAPAGEVEPLI